MSTPIAELTYEAVIKDHPELLQRQLLLEDEAANMAQSTLNDKMEKRGFAEESPSGKEHLKSFTKLFAANIDAYLEDQSKKRNKGKAYKNILLLHSEQLAFITARVMLNTATKGRSSYTTLACSIAAQCRDTAEYALYVENNKPAENALAAELKYNNSAASCVKVLRETIGYKAKKGASEEEKLEVKNFEGVKWHPRELTAMGSILINEFVDATGLFEIPVLYANKKSTKYVQPSKKLVELLEDSALRDKIILPYYLPTIIPPVPWKEMEGGGYYNERLNPIRFIKTGGKNLSAGDLDETMNAVNVIQSTAWSINKPIFEVFKGFQETGGGIKKMASSTPPDLVPKPWPENISESAFKRWKGKNPKSMADYNKKASKAHRERSKWVSHRLIQDQQVLMGNMYQDEEAFWYPANVDYRGRVYSLAGNGAINPQGTDIAKGLLRFSKGKPLGEEGAEWLAIHIANCFGEDKLSLADRSEWTDDNTDMILDCASDPYTNEQWKSADKPFQFLAAAMEWKGFVEMGEDGFSFVSHLPIAQDGSCNALQHLAALMGCKETATSTNIVPSDVPNDLYGLVLDSVKVRLAACDDPLAKPWLDRIIREIVKRPAMTFGYGCTIGGIRKQIREELEKLIADGVVVPFDDDVTPQVAANYLGPIVQAGIADHVVKGKECMDWLQHVAEELAREGLQMKWETPTGFPVEQAYYEDEPDMVKITWRGKTQQIRLRKRTNVINKNGSKRGAAPNFVHSLDASMMCMTVNDCAKKYGIDSFAAIHDSYAVHAADTGTLFVATRDAFTKLYEKDQLQTLYEKLRKDSQDENEKLTPEAFERLKEPPERGELDISVCQDSLYFFA